MLPSSCCPVEWTRSCGGLSRRQTVVASPGPSLTCAWPAWVVPGSGSTAYPPRSTGSATPTTASSSRPRGGADLAPWVAWFLSCLEQAIHRAGASVTAILARVRFWKGIADIPVNERQARVLTIMLDDFGGNLTIARWTRIAKYSQAALQDIGEPIDRDILVRIPEWAGVPATAGYQPAPATAFWSRWMAILHAPAAPILPQFPVRPTGQRPLPLKRILPQNTVSKEPANLTYTPNVRISLVLFDIHPPT